MIRIAHLSDSHFDSRGRLADVIEVHRAFLRQAKAAEVDLIVHAGDWFERRSTPEERNAVADFLQEAAAVAPLYGVKGNHDQAEDLAIFNRLDAGFESPYGAQIVEGRWSWDAIPTPKGPIYLVGIPWFDKAHVVSKMAAEDGAEAGRRLTIEMAGYVLDGIRAQIAEWNAKRGHAVVVVGHLMVAGSETSTGQVLQGITVELAPADLLELGASYVALGHIHKRQAWFDGRVAYSGSPHRCNFGEPEAKGWNLVCLEDNGMFLRNEFRELPARRMVRIEKDWRMSGGSGDEIATHAELASMRDALVRWRVQIRAEDMRLLDQGMVERFLRDAGAAEVQVEAVVEAQARARAPEIATAQSTADKVRAYVQSRGADVDEARVLAKVSELEREVAGAGA